MIYRNPEHKPDAQFLATNLALVYGHDTGTLFTIQDVTDSGNDLPELRALNQGRGIVNQDRWLLLPVAPLQPYTYRWIYPNIHQIITLSGKTRKGSNVITNHGALWEVKRIDDDVFTVFQPNVLIAAPDGDMRWIHIANDKNFEVKL